MSATSTATTRALHIVPVGGDEPLHAAAPDCWCFPLKIERSHDCAITRYSHNAKDCREVRERAGAQRPNETWVKVWGVKEPL